MCSELADLVDEKEYLEYCNLQEAEMNAVSNMISIATKEHLETEVLRWFGDYRANGESTIDACSHGLGEWIK